MNSDEILKYWNDSCVESMYDKRLLMLEVEAIRGELSPNAEVLDVGCGEGEGTYVYAKIPDISIKAVDFSDTRLAKAKERLSGQHNVQFSKLDITKDLVNHQGAYDYIITQRCLINITDWEMQKEVLTNLSSKLKAGGRLLLLEGCQEGVDELNAIRASFDLEPITVKWHNLFFNEEKLLQFAKDSGLALVKKKGFGAYFLLTRGIKPYFDSNNEWDCQFNTLSAGNDVAQLLGPDTRFSRLVFWVFEKEA